MAPVSEIFAPDLLRDRVALVTGGGTNLGREAARELLACGAHVVVAGRRADVLDEAVADLGEGASAVAGDVRDPGRRSRHRRRAPRPPRPPRRPRQQRRRPVLRARRGHHREGLGRRAAPERRRDRDDDAGGARRRPGAAGDGGTIVHVTVSPHHGMPAMAHTGAARAAVEAYGRELAAELAPRGIAVVSAAIGRFATESLKKYPEVVRPGRRAASRSSGWGRCASSPGSSPCSPRPSVAPSAARS